MVREKVKEIVTAPLTFYVGIGTDFGFPIALADATKVIGQDPYFSLFNHRDAELDERITRYLEEIGASLRHCIELRKSDWKRDCAMST